MNDRSNRDSTRRRSERITDILAWFMRKMMRVGKKEVFL
jgi:hypothetical protein